jgi:hypothetical protein
MTRALLRCLVLAGTTVFAACYDAPERADVGAAALEIAPGVTLATATYVVTGPAFMTNGSLNLQASATLATVIGPIPAGVGFDVAISGTTSTNAVCTGHAPFDIVAGQQTAVTVHLKCVEPSKTGSVQIAGTFNVCPSIEYPHSALNLSPDGSAVLSVAAHDGDAGPAPLTYHWTTTSGTLSNADVATPTFTCAGQAGALVMVTVSDGDPLASCAAQAIVSITCATPEPPVPEPEEGP